MTGIGAIHLWHGNRFQFSSLSLKDKWEGSVRSTGVGALYMRQNKRKVFPAEESSVQPQEPAEPQRPQEPVKPEEPEDEEEDPHVDLDGSFLPQDCSVYLGVLPDGMTRADAIEVVAKGLVNHQNDEFRWTGSRTSFDDTEYWSAAIDYWLEKDFDRNDEGKTKFCHLVNEESEEDVELFVKQVLTSAYDMTNAPKT